MEGPRFDDLARRLSLRVGRRATLRAMAALLLGGGGVAMTGAADAGAATCRKLGVTCSRNTQCCTKYCLTARVIPRGTRSRCACPGRTSWCAGECRDYATDRDNCGACGNVCGASETCVAGQCRCASGPGCCDHEVCLSGACEIPGGMCSRASEFDACVRTMSGSVLQVRSTCQWAPGNPECGSDADCAAVCPPGATCHCAIGMLNWFDEWEDYRRDDCLGLCIGVGCAP